MRCCSFNFGLIVLVMFGKFTKLDSPQRLVQFWKNFQTSLVLVILNCSQNRMITYTKQLVIVIVTKSFFGGNFAAPGNLVQLWHHIYL